MRPTCLLLDLDGTLIDSAPGVTASAAAALRSVGAPVPDGPTLRGFVGPPMYDTFRYVVGLDEPTARAALAAYRTEYARHGASAATVYDGIPELLDALAASGLPMGVATSKVQDQAELMTRRFGLDTRLLTVCGVSDEAGRTTKRQVIRECVTRLRDRGADVRRPLMVGDRTYDVESAAAEGIPAVHVRWGYGGEAESAGAVASVAEPAELIPLLATLPRTALAHHP
ncbi:HAD hydrolase-like protein [Streptomyces turgidiscabies]|uniref:Haloacid dehalogenase-like hydrolase n=1 Tax=Streptomyces turgidiscabies (strain Car8) TaxID=698760 RepID=L7F5B8_STRT8|nr:MULTISPECIES: HAD hydrolase-like protein [Streptomyces]ELP66778.1 haloacid dehalogenase-like hydrolase [Streptomyces turgidiscabies Car8]MDX3500045.1 HAD hydrolase-like protein [Streptomyces turgidiscabies]GAQ73748.1 5'-nucleotidase [Streptomyces turgidiscabies]